MKTIEERAVMYADYLNGAYDTLSWELKLDWSEDYDAYIRIATEQEAITKKEMVEKAMVVFQSMSIKIINTTEGGEQWRTLKENYRKALEAEI